MDQISAFIWFSVEEGIKLEKIAEDLTEKFRITISTNIENQIKISNEILPKYIDENYNNKIIFRRKQNNKKLKLNYAELFDPKTCEWEFNLDKYKKALTLLSP